MTPQEAFENIKKSDALFLRASDVAPVLNCGANDLRGQAQERPDLLGFPVMVYGSRVKIPRLPFIQFIETLPCCVRLMPERSRARIAEIKAAISAEQESNAADGEERC